MILLDPIQCVSRIDLPREERDVVIPVKAQSKVEVQEGPAGDFGVLVDDNLVVSFDSHERALGLARDVKKNCDKKFGHVVSLTFVVNIEGAYWP